jgi:NhaP-type Na+/H+ or K+/H+ antiporter
MWIAGLRGAMAYALAINSIGDYGEPGKIMLSITLIYAILTILFVGSALNPILNYCEVTKQLPVVANPDNIHQERKRCCQGFKKMVADYDQRYFSPIFTMQKT